MGKDGLEGEGDKQKEREEVPRIVELFHQKEVEQLPPLDGQREVRGYLYGMALFPEVLQCKVAEEDVGQDVIERIEREVIRPALLQDAIQHKAEPHELDADYRKH